MLGFKGPRRMTVLIPGMTHDQKRVQIIPQNKSDSMMGKVKTLIRIKCYNRRAVSKAK